MSDKVLSLKYTLNPEHVILKETLKKNFKHGILTEVKRNGVKIKKIDDQIYYTGLQIEIIDKIKPSEAIKKVDFLKNLEYETIERLNKMEHLAREKLYKMEIETVERLNKMELELYQKLKNISELKSETDIDSDFEQ